MKKTKRVLKQRQQAKKIGLDVIISVLSGQKLCKDMTQVNEAIEFITSEEVNEKSLKILRNISACYLQYKYPELRNNDICKSLDDRLAKSDDVMAEKDGILKEWLAERHKTYKMSKVYRVKKLSKASYQDILKFIAKKLADESKEAGK